MSPTADITGLLVAVSNGEEAARTHLIEAPVLQLSRPSASVSLTVKRDWALARAWLHREMRGQPV